MRIDIAMPLPVAAMRHAQSMHNRRQVHHAGIASGVRLFKRDVDTYRPGRPEPDWLDVHRERKHGSHVTVQLLWLEYRRRMWAAGLYPVLYPLPSLGVLPRELAAEAQSFGGAQ
jgi:hypothetical protein